MVGAVNRASGVAVASMVMETMAKGTRRGKGSEGRANEVASLWQARDKET